MAEKYERIGEILSGMVKIPTVSGTGNEADYHIDEYKEYLKKVFPALLGAAETTDATLPGPSVAIMPVGDALLCRLAGRAGEAAKPPVLFTGHMDVVPAADSPAWEYPPFSGQIVQGSVWGRGSQDMKGPQCALLSAFDSLLSEGWRPERDIWLYLSCDEEVGGETTEQAARWLKEKGIYFETVFDEGGTICEDFMGLVKGRAAMFGIAEKGSLEYRFTALSKGGHAANPPEHSAIVRLGEFMAEIEGTDLFRRELSEGNRAMLRRMADCTDGKLREKLLKAAGEDGDYSTLYEICPQAKNLLGATIAFTMIEGGTAFNVLPKKAVLTANVRVSCVETCVQVTEKLERLAQRYDLLCELVGGSDATPESSVGSAGYRAMEKSVNEIYPGLPVIPFVLGGGTDSKHFLQVAGQVLRFSPMYAAPEQGNGVHGDNESAYIEAVRDAARCYECLLRKYL